MAGGLDKINRGFWSVLLAVLASGVTLMLLSTISVTQQVGVWPLPFLVVAYFVVAWRALRPKEWF